MSDKGKSEIPATLAALHAEASQFVAAVAGKSTLKARYEGRDSRGVVTVTTLPDGRIGTVTIADQWRSEVRPADLGGVVLEAIEDAGRQRMLAWAHSIDIPPASGAGPAGRTSRGKEPPGAPVAEPSAAPGVTPLPSVSGPVGDPAAPDAMEAVRELSELLAGARAALAAVTARLEERQSAETTGRSHNRKTRVTLRGNQPIAVDFDGVWLSRASAEAVGVSVGEALADAYARHGRLGMNDLVAGTPLATLRDLTTDPAELARRVGLLGESSDSKSPRRRN